ncbi:MAG TPA: 23S rRNA (adenine(2030)-N(6))-methyltransferase RlmJ [Methylibium sp.]|uniref:23S rRNA (adenine(2030)-N(6))-methyltransferase RlmJ n=1 Tax=Methylibium sp. TaxID=2067992 RepID=UPI002DBB1826|nr:23S rRNA (adenine(2030)-N(6))-methyltransferase RlmJ [Methylibium sp.]HEU4458514.1 23S rRNA (adenine(2030)-N(6))-methyltransferase RlmJ [Methylibium sp.]
MLAYRHAFHAGNHADVLKHTVLVHVLDHMAKKDKGYTLIDTHAGAGGYSLLAPEARKNAEADRGIARLVARDDLPAAVARYVELVRAFNPEGGLGRYPGSPEIARMLLRPQDHLRLYELHPADLQNLAVHHAGRAHTEVHGEDGFSGLAMQLPPPSRRGVVLMDPAYEMKADYTLVVGSVREALQRFAEAVVVVWVPQVTLLAAQQLPKRLTNAANASQRGWLHARLTVQPPDRQGFGLAGSSVVVINPPWTLQAALKQSLPFLAKALAQYDGASYALEHHEPKATNAKRR